MSSLSPRGGRLDEVTEPESNPHRYHRHHRRYPVRTSTSPSSFPLRLFAPALSKHRLNAQKRESWGSLARPKHLKNRNPKSLRVCHWKQLAGPCSPVYISYRVKAVNAEDRINFMTSACINRYCFPRKDVLQAGKHL